MGCFEKIEEYIAGSEIDAALKHADTVVCAFSGGADSRLLLEFLSEYLKKREVHLVCAHMNHMIRGSRADSDEAFCKETALRLGLPFYSKRVDIPKTAKESGKTLEECARDERYSFLRHTAARLGENTLIATAHNATDNLETVLFNLIRGTGTKGLGGIAPSQGGIIRPLLCLTGEEIRAEAEARALLYVTDETNLCTEYTRNFIRHKIVPLTREINPASDSAALRLSKTARADAAYMENEANKLLGGKDYVRRDAFTGAPAALRPHILLLLYAKAAGCGQSPGQKNTERGVSFAISKTGTLSMPGKITLVSDTDRIYFEKQKSDSERVHKIILPVDGTAYPFGSCFAAAAVPKGASPVYDKNIYNLFILQAASFGKIYDNLFIRQRRDGDRILAGGMHKKLKKLMCDKKVPRRYRDLLPVFCDGEGILWAPGAGLRDGCGGDDVTLYVFARKGSLIDE